MRGREAELWYVYTKLMIVRVHSDNLIIENRLLQLFPSRWRTQQRPPAEYNYSRVK